MKLTKDIVKTVSIIDCDAIKVGDVLRFTNKKYQQYTIIAKVLDVEIDKIKVHYVEPCNIINIINVDELKMLESLHDIEKAENNNLSKFKINDRYKVEDINSSDMYYATVIDVTDKEICLKRDSGKFTIVTNSQIGTVYKFVEYHKRKLN